MNDEFPSITINVVLFSSIQLINDGIMVVIENFLCKLFRLQNVFWGVSSVKICRR